MGDRPDILQQHTDDLSYFGVVSVRFLTHPVVKWPNFSTRCALPTPCCSRRLNPMSRQLSLFLTNPYKNVFLCPIDVYGDLPVVST
ncbi:MAG: hypothetical protein ACK56F_21155 [bacterium]